jgi:exosortase
MTQRRLLSTAWIGVSLLLFLRPASELIRLSLVSQDISYVGLIPFLAAGVLFVERQQIPRVRSYDTWPAIVCLVLAGAVAVLTYFSRSASIGELRLPGYILSLVLFWVAGFAFLFGRTALSAAQFSLAFLVLTVPPPHFLVGRVTYLLQLGSAYIVGAFFEVLRVPFLREGFVFHLATVDIEVAKECSGIRSSMALLVLALLIAHFQLKSLPAKVIFVVCGLVMMILKNGIRIVTLTLLAMYVDPSFLFGRLHHQGGVVFFLFGLLLLLPFLAFLKWGESRWLSRQPSQF